MRCRTPPLVVLSASAGDATRLYSSFDDEVYSMHELSGGGSVVSHSNGGTPRGQAGGSGALHVFHRTAPAAVSSAGSGSGNHLASSTASLVASMGTASSVGSVSTAPAAAPAASTSTGSGSSGGVITPLPRAAIQKSSLYELCAAFQELSRALAAMEVVACKRARMRSEAYIIKFEHEYADLARVKNRAMKRLEALLRAGPGGTPAFAPDSAHAQVLGGVLRVVLDLDDELLLLMGTEHGTWEELKRLRGEIARHLLVLGRELGGCDAGGEGPASFDPLSPVPLARSLSSPTGSIGGGASSGGGGGGSSVFSFAPAAVAASAASRVGGGHSKRKAVVGVGRGERSGSPKSEEDVFKLRPLEASLSSLGSSSGGGGGNGGSGGMGALSGASSSGGSNAATGAQHQSQQQQQGPRRPAPLQQLAPAGRGAEGIRDPESPGTMTTASLSSSTSSAFSQLSDCGGSDEERCAPEAGGGRKGRSSAKAKAAGAGGTASRKALASSTGAGGAAASASGAYHQHHRSLPAPMNKSVSSDALSGLLNPLPAALTARVREKVSFLHHRTLGTTGAGAGGGAGGAIPGTGSRTPLYDVASGAAAARPRYHTTVGAGAATGPATAGRGVSGMRPMMEAAAKS